jgi:hypothetical protein
MRKKAIPALIIVSAIILTAGLVLSRSARAKNMKVHKKDLPEHGLVIIGPSDPSFDALLAAHLKGEPSEVIDNLKPFSFFVENRSNQMVVAYTVQWCFTKVDGTNDCYVKALTNPRALMDGDNLSDEMVERSEKIKPHSTRYFSLISLDGTGSLSVPASPAEVEQLRQGIRPDKGALLRRYSAELSKYSDITFTIDGAFFDDGTFVGPDVTGFFEETKAQITAQYDVLNEIAQGVSSPGKTKEDVFKGLETIAGQPEINLDSKSKYEDQYKYYKRFYAAEILQSRRYVGDEKALKLALRPMKKPWRILQKKKS